MLAGWLVAVLRFGGRHWRRPVAIGESVVLRAEVSDAELVFVEADDLAQILDHGSNGDDEVYESVAANCSLLGVCDVFILAAL